MEVKLVTCTASPIEIISLAAGTSYGKDDTSVKRVETCVNNGHLSVLEHVSMTWKVSGISRSCSHQLVRHRLASYTEKSLRYTEPQEGWWYVFPPVFEHRPYLEMYISLMKQIETLYFELLEYGLKKEDARFILPLATKTEITVTMNLREFVHFYKLRSAKDAQWEIRALAKEMFNSLYQFAPDYDRLLDMIFDE